MAVPRSVADAFAGREDFQYPATRSLRKLAGGLADVVQLHNLHGGYFDLRVLPRLSSQIPVVVTAHDMWLATGHCAQTLDSDRWLQGCGDCPHLETYPAVRRDATAANWRFKRAIYDSAEICLASPSRWLAGRLERSMLATAIVESRVVPNGVDLEVFAPGDGRDERARLALPEGLIMLFVGSAARTSSWRDFESLRAAAKVIGQRVHGIILVVGDDGQPETYGGMTINYAGRVAADELAAYYRASDLYVHPARVDTFPTAVLEALASGIPVVATAVGGIPEQLRPESGVLVPPNDPTALAAALENLAGDEPGRTRIGRAARADAVERFDVRQQVETYLRWFAELTEGIPRAGGGTTFGGQPDG